MARHQIEVSDDSAEALEAAIAQLRLIGMPEGTKLRIRTRASFSADGAFARSVTARWVTGGEAQR